MDLVSWTFGGDIADTDKPVRITSSVYTSAPSSLTDQILVDTVSPFNSLSFKQLATQVRQLIAGLRAQGVQPGDCVCVNCFNDVRPFLTLDFPLLTLPKLQYSVLYFGIIGAGAIFTGLNPAFTPNELRHHFDLTKPSLFIVEPPMLEKTLTAAKMAGIPTDRMYAFDTATPNFDPSICSWTALLSYGECDWVKPEDPDTTTASYNPTSGTSGLPKVAMITHSYHVTQAASQCEETGYQVCFLLSQIYTSPEADIIATAFPTPEFATFPCFWLSHSPFKYSPRYSHIHHAALCRDSVLGLDYALRYHRDLRPAACSHGSTKVSASDARWPEQSALYLDGRCKRQVCTTETPV